MGYMLTGNPRYVCVCVRVCVRACACSAQPPSMHPTIKPWGGRVPQVSALYLGLLVDASAVLLLATAAAGTPPHRPFFMINISISMTTSFSWALLCV